MKLLITGKGGQVGSELEKILKNNSFDVNLLSRDNLDICDEKNLFDVINKLKPKIIINLAAFTDVKGAEKKVDESYDVNSNGVLNIVNVCKQNSILLIHISTDYVFDGKKEGSYTEDDVTNPINIYGKSKLQGEQNIINNLETFIIIRTSWIFSSFGNNFLKNIIKSIKNNKKLVVVGDQIGGPTVAKNLANIIILFCKKYKIENKLDYGIYHYSNLPNVSWYDFAKAITDKLKINNFLKFEEKFLLEKSKTIDGNVVRRPLNSKLSNIKIKKYLGIEDNYWTLSLDECLNDLYKKKFYDE